MTGDYEDEDGYDGYALLDYGDKCRLDETSKPVAKDLKTLRLSHLIATAVEAFLALSAACPYKNDTDCAEPSMESSHVTCSTSNCPLLLDAGA